MLTDSFGRTKRKLRLSLTDRCHFRCLYCMPETPKWLPKKQLLQRTELFALAKIMVEHGGIDAIRLTGGEPLLYPELPELLDALQTLYPLGLKKIAMTTNADLLHLFHELLLSKNILDLNVSLDSISEANFYKMSGGRGNYQRVLDNIIHAKNSGFNIKLNCVPVKNWNESEIVPLAKWAFLHQIPLRFIEYMPLDDARRWQNGDVITQAEIFALLQDKFALVPCEKTARPAQEWQIEGTNYRFGFISTVSVPFCARCDRLRITADGHLYTCLFAEKGLDLRPLLRAQNAHSMIQTDQNLIKAVQNAVWHKSAGYAAIKDKPLVFERAITMHTLGG